MERDVIDGVAVVWRELAGPLRAELTFGCGHRDEDLDTIGLTHFVQLLACPDPDHAGMASHLTTSFTLEGPADQIVAELAAICSALSAGPDPDRMAEVAAQADPGERFSGLGFDDDLRYPFASLLSRRFGASGPGLVRWPVVDYGRFTADQVRVHARRYFTASNAVLTLTGRPPSGLGLPLPRGPRPDRVALPFKSTPFWYQDEVEGAGISFHAEAGPLPYLVLRLVSMRLGKSLRAMPDGMLLDETWHEFGLTLTPRGRRAAEAAQEAWAQLRRVASSGAAQAELDDALAGLEEQAASAMARLNAATHGTEEFEIAVERELFGASESFSDAEWAQMANVTPHQIQQAVAGWLRSAIIVVPRGQLPVLDGVAESPCPTSVHPPAGEVFRPGPLQRLRHRDARVVLSPAGVSIVDTSGAHFTGAGDLLVIAGDAGAAWVGDPGHGCLHDISAFGPASDRIRQAAPEIRRRHTAV